MLVRSSELSLMYVAFLWVLSMVMTCNANQPIIQACLLSLNPSNWLRLDKGFLSVGGGA
jgi:hypothetical protein